MIFDWRAEKSQRCRAERGFGFDYAARLFAGPTLERIDDCRDYGEVRVQALGTIDGLDYVVVYTHRVDAEGKPVRWIISARRARAKEVRTWRGTLNDLMATPPDLDRAKIEATTEDDIRRHMMEDGEDPEAEPGCGFELVLPAKAVRKRLGLRQADFAAVLQVPLATVRNWEQGRTLPDPAARSLLNVVARAPEAVLTALRPDRRDEWRAIVGAGLRELRGNGSGTPSP